MVGGRYGETRSDNRNLGPGPLGVLADALTVTGTVSWVLGPWEDNTQHDRRTRRTRQRGVPVSVLSSRD